VPSFFNVIAAATENIRQEGMKKLRHELEQLIQAADEKVGSLTTLPFSVLFLTSWSTYV